MAEGSGNPGSVLIIAAAVVTAIGTLIGGLGAAGAFGGGRRSPITVSPVASQSTVTTTPATDSPTSPPPTTPPTTRPARTTAPAPAESSAPSTRQRASIRLVYEGDVFGCGLQLAVRVGGQTVFPSGRSYVVENVRTGEQEYSVQGTISCPTAGFCQASGTGTIDVVDGESYRVGWLNVAVGTCTVTLT
ncbi:hypothetical protein Ga0074812_13340 [Parafrankia irregularis]|uniref:Uncharacterized protein n=1 Tax=Parafrankia irregularis TaxID=795642 RepID=A0A0S4QYD4_9ACTN|nr:MULTISPECIES: hypothetical protein [Parafrankia]MBE3206466.1 hypothetical protein [Parafrankia sp. CH37]CUU59916.1 hypothetical protein Ga0074812_13340 [Parafrankia irregularis]